MTGDTAIKVEGVSKKFCRRLRHSMLYGTLDVARGMLGMEARTDTLRAGEFWAVKEISLELKRGETLGLIGPNGSGKSTLLRLLNGIYAPDVGRIEIRGRIGALIAVGAGFHPLMTGRENIYLNGAILGMSRSEIDSRFGEIVEFADIGDFLDAPVKTYSSGMTVRLGFAISIHCDPDILLVDEVLAVGDFGFRQKCFGKINELRNRASVILVSHNMRDFSMLCDKALLLDNGRILHYGGPAEVIERYMEVLRDRETSSGPGTASTAASALQNLFGPKYHNRDRIKDVRHVWKDADNNEVNVLKHGDTLALEYSFRLLAPTRNIIIGVPVYNKDGTLVTSLSTDFSNTDIEISDDGVVRGRLVLDRLVLNNASYVSAFAVVDGNEFLYRNFNNEFRVGEMPVSLGYFTHEHRWEFRHGLSK